MLMQVTVAAVQFCQAATIVWCSQQDLHDRQRIGPITSLLWTCSVIRCAEDRVCSKHVACRVWTPSRAVKTSPLYVQSQALDGCAGAIEALMLLNPYLAPGCIVLFDDLVNYPDYREHEIRALWEWLQASKRQVEVFSPFLSVWWCLLRLFVGEPF